jgi:ketosteroid isomerase-like protein
MRNATAIISLLALLCSTVAAEPAQRPDASAAEQVARAYLVALRAQGVAATADFMHPDDMARFRAMLLPAFEAEARAGRRALINATFGRGATLTDVRQAHPADFMRHCARVMAVRMPPQPTGFEDLTVLGSVAENDWTHVLVRTRSGSGETATERLVVVTLRPYDGTWKVALSGELEDAAGSVGESLQGRRSRPLPIIDHRRNPRESNQPH